MGENLSPETLYQFIVNDFEDAWNSLAGNQWARGRGNFMFARQAMTLLEWAARLCSSDSTGTALAELSLALKEIDPRYFTPLPGPCADFSDFDLPSDGPNPQAQLLWAMFDQIRHGQAHQYQQILVHLADALDFQVALTGAQFGMYLNTVLAGGRPRGHLCFHKDDQNGLWLIVRPEVLFLDIKAAIDNSGLLTRGLTFLHLPRPRSPQSPYYQFESNALEQALEAGGHQRI